MDSTTRHWRFLRNREFDMAELSCSSYIVARDQGLPFRAMPVFLHRRFRHGFIFINTGKGITKPTDLIGRKIGVKSVPGRRRSTGCAASRARIRRAASNRSNGIAELDEDIEFTPPPGLKLTRLPHDKIGRDDAGRGRARRGAAFRPDQAASSTGTARRAALPRSTRRRRWRISARPASSRSCM